MKEVEIQLGVDSALFLDVDGTLVDFAATPEAVEVDVELPQRLGRLARRFGGALALVSGRSIADLDRMFRPFRFAAAGVHGAERRDAEGRLHYCGLSSAELDPARVELERFVAQHPAVVLEDKGRGLALHFRRAPELESAVREAMREALGRLPAGAAMQAGHYFLEVKGGGSSKRASVEAFMREAPFAGRAPVYLGDDLTDLDAIAYAAQSGGRGIFVGPEPRPGWDSLPAPAAVREWLKSLDRKRVKRDRGERG
ncbi:MAG: trehalose-phosphatase [Steroidobacteraceae bacterium]